MGARWISLGVFVLTVLAVNAWSNRRDRPAGVPFTLRAPEGFERMNKQEAAEMLLGDEEAAKEAGQGSLFLRYGKDDEDKRYTEVLQVEEDDYAVRMGEADRSSHFDRGVLEIGDHALKILDSKVTRLGPNEVLVARLSAEVESDGGKLPVRLTRYVLPSDRGRAFVDAYCLEKDEATYRPLFDASVAAARGVATRPGKLPWYYVSLIGGGAALLSELALRLRVGKGAPEAPRPADVPDEDAVAPRPAKKTSRTKPRGKSSPAPDEADPPGDALPADVGSVGGVRTRSHGSLEHPCRVVRSPNQA